MVSTTFINIVTIMALNPIAAAVPIKPTKLSADSITMFEDDNLAYPRLHDALHSLCRGLSTEPRSYELDRHYRTHELQRALKGDLTSVCAEYLMRPMPSKLRSHGKTSKVVYVGTGSP